MAATDTGTAAGTSPTADPERFDVRRVVAVALGLTALLTLLLIAFTWPPSELKPRSLPLAAAGPADAVAGIDAELAAALGDDAVDMVEVDDRGAAVEAIKDREAYGAIVAGPDGVEVLTASAASTQVSQLLAQAAQRMTAQGGVAPTVTDVVPTPSGDPRGAVFSAGALPLALGGIMVGAMTSLALRRTRDRVAAAVLVGLAGGTSSEEARSAEDVGLGAEPEVGLVLLGLSLHVRGEPGRGLARERVANTYLGEGIAIPHGKLPEIKELFGLSRKVAIPLLELLDDRGWTRRLDAGHREVVR